MFNNSEIGSAYHHKIGIQGILKYVQAFFNWVLQILHSFNYHGLDEALSKAGADVDPGK